MIYLQENCGKFNQNILYLYGEETKRLIRSLENRRVKKAKLLARLAFLRRCRVEEVIPTFLTVQHHIKTSAARRILKHASSFLLKERIRHTRKEIFENDQQLYSLHLHLSNRLDSITWMKIDRRATSKATDTHEEATRRQKSKLQRLLEEQQKSAGPKLTTDKVVINLTTKPLDETTTQVLAKGLNFAATPTTIPKEEIIAAVETAVQKLPAHEADEIRFNTYQILKQAKAPKSNLTPMERRAIRELRLNKDIVVLPADKGNATVVMDRKEYSQKTNSLLEDATYRKMAKDPTKVIERKISEAIKTSTIPKDDQKGLIPKESTTPRLYCLPKVHKEGIPLRPIVSAIGSPSHKLARYLCGFFKNITGQTEHHIENSTHFIDKLKQIRLNPDDIMVSFDVKSLFTNIPMNTTLELASTALLKQGNADLIMLLQLCASNTYFKFEGNIYEQTKGTAMGSPLSPALANIYMEHFESTAIKTASHKPAYWFRYVDDTFVVWPHGKSKLDDFLHHLNNQHPDIQFTMECEKDDQLPFLDVLIYKKSDGSLGHKVYRKPTHTDRYINADSNHHPAQKQGVINTLVNRAFKISDEEHISDELNHLTKALQKNGFQKKDINRVIRKHGHPKDRPEKEHIGLAFLPYIQGCTDKISRIFEKSKIRTIFTPGNKISNSVVQIKDSTGKLQMPGVYEIPCSCGRVYIGETGRSIETRISEHRRATNNKQWEKSAVAEHAITENHHVDFENTKILVREKFWGRRIFRESMEIFKNTNNFNRDKGRFLPHIWKHCISAGEKPPKQTSLRDIGETQMSDFMASGTPI